MFFMDAEIKQGCPSCPFPPVQETCHFGPSGSSPVTWESSEILMAQPILRAPQDGVHHAT